MRLSRIDHIVITVSDLGRSLRFYTEVVGLRTERVDDERHVATLRAGEQLIRLQTADRRATGALTSARPVAGAADLCVQTEDDGETVGRALRAALGADAVIGPVRREGARGPMVSHYAHDPDGSLIELCSYEGGRMRDDGDEADA